LTYNGKTSPTMTQAAGPQEMAKVAMFRQIKATIAEIAELLCFSILPAVTPIMPT